MASWIANRELQVKINLIGDQLETREGRKMSELTDTLAERGARYGDFTDHATVAQQLQDVMHNTANWARLSADKKQALQVIADKQARILTGDPEYRDSWHDIQGYAKLVEDRCAPADRATQPLPFPPVSDGHTVDDFTGPKPIRPWA